MCSLLLLIGTTGRHCDDPAPDAVTRRSDLHGWHPRRERRWITKLRWRRPAGTASVADTTLPTSGAMGTFAVDRASRPASHRRPAGSGDRIRRAEFTATQGARLAAGHRPRRHPM